MAGPPTPTTPTFENRLSPTDIPDTPPTFNADPSQQSTRPTSYSMPSSGRRPQGKGPAQRQHGGRDGMAFDDSGDTRGGNAGGGSIRGGGHHKGSQDEKLLDQNFYNGDRCSFELLLLDRDGRLIPSPLP
ncbi:hypothetical protein HKX48_002452 [Thoreauomyces humboldtii]|nr:hypothetical protein HKX48_002452 [Thoreauomyces humboldtii]